MEILYDTTETDITEYVQIRSFSVRENAYNRSNTCSFAVRKRGAYGFEPAGNKDIKVMDGATTVFYGVIVSVNAMQVAVDEVEYTVTCKSREHYLDRLLVLDRFEDETVEDIIDALVAEYAPSFTTTNVSCTLTVDTIAFNRISLTQCLDKLAKLVNYTWYLDYDDDIHFFANTSETAPFEVTDTNGNYILGTMQLARDYTQIRNRIVLQGGEAVGAARTEQFAGNGEQTTFPLGYKYNALPTVEVDGSVVDVGVDFIQNPDDYDCMWSRQQKYLSFNSGSVPPAPTSPATTNIEVTGLPLYPIFLQYQDSASISTYGVYEFFIKDLNIKSRGEALERIQAELDAYKDTVTEGSFRTYTSGLRAGRLLTIDSDLLGVDEAFVIQSITIRMESVDRATYDVRLATLRTLGIIDVLQQQVYGEKIQDNEEELLQAFVTQSDTASISDSIGTPVTTSPPYAWGTPEWGFFTWS